MNCCNFSIIVHRRQVTSSKTAYNKILKNRVEHNIFFRYKV